jgi:hypothetical protein
MAIVSMAFRAIGVLFAPCWLHYALFNATVAWRAHVRKVGQGRSAVPLVGAICAFLASLLWSIGTHPGRSVNPLSQKLLWLALFLDYGSIPVFALWALHALRSAARHP